FIGGNWKMNTLSSAAADLANALSRGVEDIDSAKVDIAVFPPSVYLQLAAKTLSASNISVGAQDVYFEHNGAFTGQLSCEMLKDVGCAYVLIGHSERRHIMGEGNELINKKITAAINGGLLPIFCVGELLEERQADRTTAVVTEQIEKGLSGIDIEKAHAITIAYEPVWAIGTGQTASPQQAQQTHQMIRQLIERMYGADFAEKVRIQYGGSVKPDNAAELITQDDIDGFLVGGASLKFDDFVAIIKAAVKN
ncbi:MAG: triose-phosphate isomerase, partial [Planctomycetes bacterium]|nr:triose-phosphate isomerase [Planctomycetota bacterium]